MVRTKTAPISIRVDPAVKNALERAAKVDDRSLSYVIEKALRDHLAARGLLKASDKASRYSRTDASP